MTPKLEERRPAITPQLAVRVAVLGGIAFALFAIVFFRLWFLQVLSGDDYVTQARENRVRKIKIEAPRGDIVDRNGNRLVRTRVAPVVQVVPGALPEAELEAADVYRRARSPPNGGASPPRASCTTSSATAARMTAASPARSAASTRGWAARHAPRATSWCRPSPPASAACAGPTAASAA